LPQPFEVGRLERQPAAIGAPVKKALSRAAPAFSASSKRYTGLIDLVEYPPQRVGPLDGCGRLGNDRNYCPGSAFGGYPIMGVDDVDFLQRLLLHYGIYRRYPLRRWPAFKNAWRIAFR
jgi:hypothetical protein